MDRALAATARTASCASGSVAPARSGRCGGGVRPRTVRCRVAKPDTADSPTASTSEPAARSTDGRQRAALRASKSGRQAIVERQRPLADYMALPASQYSVLDARRIERIDDETFRCFVGELRFFSWSVEPVITVSVAVERGGCTIRLLGCELQGSPFVEDMNNRFKATMTNVVRYRDLYALDPESDFDEDLPPETQKEIVSDTSIQVVLEVPPWCGFIPVSSIEAAGSSVMQGVLNATVPRFLAQLRVDYEKWAAGDESRKPVGEI